MANDYIELKPIRETTENYEAIEQKIKALFKKELYLPLLREVSLNGGALKNAQEGLAEAIRNGRITYRDGRFTGKFNAAITRELKSLGAMWDKSNRNFILSAYKLPINIQTAVAASEAKFKERLQKIDKKLASVIPEELASKLKIDNLFDRTIWQTENDFQKSVKNITIAPKLSEEMARRISDEWQENMDIWISKFAEDEISKLREQVRASTFAGNRYESLIDVIQKSYGVTARKAKFLARQETALLMTKYKEVRYQEAGVNEYKWRCVTGTANHPVRPRHRQLNDESLGGKIFRFDQPPITSEPSQPARRNNPGADYNCRCVAIPIVKFRK